MSGPISDEFQTFLDGEKDDNKEETFGKKKRKYQFYCICPKFKKGGEKKLHNSNQCNLHYTTCEVLKEKYNAKKQTIKKADNQQEAERPNTPDNTLEDDDHDDEDAFDAEEDAIIGTFTPHDQVWPKASFQSYVGKYPELAPKLIRITAYHVSSFSNALPHLTCVFEHPTTFDEKTLVLNSTFMYQTPQYQKKVEYFLRSNNLWKR